MEFASDFNLSNEAGNRLLSLIRLGQSLPDAAVPKDHRRMVERNSNSYGRSTTSIRHTISFKHLHPSFMEIPDINFEYVV